jgi:hypothetical protein
MTFELRIINCLYLTFPLLAWNLILGPKITDPRITSDEYSPKWLLMAENILRIFVFTLPLLIPLQLDNPIHKFGLVVYIAGTMVYFASWLPLILAPHSAWSNSVIGLMSPRITPLLAFLGIAFIGESWLYGILSAIFIALHTIHGFQNLSGSRK